MSSNYTEIGPAPGAASGGTPAPGGLTEIGPAPTAQDGDSLSRFAKSFWAQANPVEGIKGIAHLVANPIQDYQTDAVVRQNIMDQAAKDFKDGNFLQATSRAMYALMPFMGAQLNKAGNQLNSGDVAGGAGTLAGIGTAAVAPELAGKALGGLGSAVRASGEGLYKNALGRGATAEQASVGVSNALPFTDKGAAKLETILNDLGTKEQAAVAGSGKTISMQKVADAASSDMHAKMGVGAQIAPSSADIATINKTIDSAVSSNPPMLTGEEALALKKGTYQNLPKNAYNGEGKSALVETQESLAHNMNQELHSQFPELKAINGQQSDFLDFKPQFLKAVEDASNRTMSGGLVRGSAALGVAGITEMLTHKPALAVTAGIMERVLNDPSVKARLAIGLYKAGKTSGMTLPLATARVSAYASALGNAASQETPDQSAP